MASTLPTPLCMIKVHCKDRAIAVKNKGLLRYLRHT